MWSGASSRITKEKEKENRKKNRKWLVEET
jgi:hypothetical protein